MENYDLDNFEPAAKIVVIGVGGAGNNAVNRMIDEEITNVDFWVANTDKQALSTSKARNRIVLGMDITGGLGAGGEPEIGEKAAESSVNDIKEIVNGANMVFIAAGMGGGTGSGAAPVIARIAKDAGALVVAIVTRPFTFEGKRRIVNSIEGLNKLKQNVDSIIVVSNDKLLMTNGSAPMCDAFSESDKVLAQSVKTVVNLIMLPSVINLDFADVKATLKDSGVSMIGFGMGSGPNRAKDAATMALSSALLEVSITGAKRAIVAVTCGKGISLFDAQECVNLLIAAAGHDIDIKFGVTLNNQLDDELLVSVIASDFEDDIIFSDSPNEEPHKEEQISHDGEENTPTDLFGNITNEEKKEEHSIELNGDDILPNFLKD